MPHDVTNPDCPHCGCNATDLVGAGSRWGKPWAVFECDHCGKEFSLGQRPAGNTQPYYVEFAQQRCPFCQSHNTEVTSSPAAKNGVKTRSHRCNDCRRTFGSREFVQQPTTRPTRNGHGTH